MKVGVRPFILLTLLLVTLPAIVLARPAGYTHMLSISVHNPNPYSVYYYPIIVDLNIGQYTQSDFNDIRVFLVTDVGETELNYSKEIIDENTVRLYVFVDEIPMNETIIINVYFGKSNDNDHSTPITDPLALKYLSLRVGNDVEVGGSTWTPYWSQLNRCPDYVWEDAGRDAFDNFGYPQIVVNSARASLSMNPYASCNPRTVTVGGITFRTESFAMGYYGCDNPNPHNPSSACHQRIWVQEVVPRCDTRGATTPLTIKYNYHGNLGSDGGTRHWSFTENNATILNRPVTYYVSNDERDPYGTRGDPQIHYLIVAGDLNQSTNFRRSGDNITYEITLESNIPLPIIAMLGVGDIRTVSHDYFADFFNNVFVLGEPCYVDNPLEINVSEIQTLVDVNVSYPGTIYREHNTVITIYVNGQEVNSVLLLLDWNETIEAEEIDENTWVANLVVPRTVPVGEHNIGIVVDDELVETFTINVDYGGVPKILEVDYQSEPVIGQRYTAVIYFTCTIDDCRNIHVSTATIGNCVVIESNDVGFSEYNTENYTYFDYVCTETEESNTTIVLRSASGSDQITITLNPVAKQTTYDIELYAPDYVSADEPLTVSVYIAQLTIPSVTVTLVDSNFNVIESVVATNYGQSYYTTLQTDGLPHGTYYIIASSDLFSIVRPVTILPSYQGDIGVIVDDGYGKPVSILDANVDGDNLVLHVSILNERQTSVTLDLTDVINGGGFVQLPQDFIPVLDSITVEDNDGVVYQVETTYSNGSIYVAWHTGSGTITLPPGRTEFTITVQSPYILYATNLYNNSSDQTILSFVDRMREANTLYEQYKVYLELKQYLEGAIYGSLDVTIRAPLTISTGQHAYAYIYVKQGGEYVTPDQMECNIVDDQGNVVETCAMTTVSDGVYLVDLYTVQEGIYGITVTAHKGLYMDSETIYYQVAPVSEAGELMITNFVVAPNTTTVVLYSQDPAATVTIRMYDQTGTLLLTDEMTYNGELGVFEYELNIGDLPDGDYIILVTDTFGYSDRAIIHVSSILEDILATVTDVDAFLKNVIEPRLLSIQSDINTLLDGQHNLYTGIEELNNKASQVLETLSQLEQNIDQYQEETIQYLQEINQVAHQVLQEVIYIKQKIDNVIVPKLDLAITNQTEILGDVNDIKLMLNCETPSAVCTHLSNIELLLQDIQNDLNASTGDIVDRLDQIESKVDTLQNYANILVEMLDCNYAYPTTSLCAKADVLLERVATIRDELSDVNTFLNRIYDYVRNDLTNEVIAVGQKVEDINNYLHGDVWNKLSNIYNRVNGLYSEANRIYSLIEGHDALVQAQLTNIQSYLTELNSYLTTKIEEVQDKLLSYIVPMSAETNAILSNTNALIAYFHCNQPNQVCMLLNSIYAEASDINETVLEIKNDVEEVKGIAISEFANINTRLDRIESNVVQLQSMLDCQTYPSSPICTMLSEIKQSSDSIRAYLVEMNQDMFDLFGEIKEAMTKKLSSSGGGGLVSIAPIKVVYRGGTVYVAVPDYIPPGKYKVEYVGKLYRYVESPEPGTELDIENGIFELKLTPDAKGVISGEIHLRSGSRVFRIKVDVIADDRLNQKVTASLVSNYLTLSIPDGGARVQIKGPLANCVENDTMYFAKSGTYKVKLSCRADGVVEIIPKSLNQSTIQISVSQKPQIVSQNYDIFKTTALPITIFITLLFVLSYLGLI